MVVPWEGPPGKMRPVLYCQVIWQLQSVFHPDSKMHHGRVNKHKDKAKD